MRLGLRFKAVRASKAKKPKRKAKANKAKRPKGAASSSGGTNKDSEREKKRAI
jgi:hypothetical protein